MFQGSRCFRWPLRLWNLADVQSWGWENWRHAWWYPQIIHLLIGISIINFPFWGTPIFGNTHMESCGVIALLRKCSVQLTKLRKYRTFASKNLIFERVFNMFLRILRKKDLETKSGPTIGKRPVTRQGMLEKDLSKSLRCHVFHHPQSGTFRWRKMFFWVGEFYIIEQSNTIQYNSFNWIVS